MDNHGTPGGGNSNTRTQSNINVNEFAAKFKGKREVFNFLTLDVKAYLPAYETITVYFMKDVISGVKKFIPCDRVRHLYVPQYESLKLALIMENVLTIPEALAHLPDLKELKKTPKPWLCNIVYSVVGDEFAIWVHQRISERNQKVTIQKDLNIIIDPAVLVAFQGSNSVSLSKGSSVQMLKANAKRRLSRAEYQEKKRIDANKDAALQEKLQEISDLKKQLDRAKKMEQKSQEHVNLLNRLQDSNIIKLEDSGIVSVISTPAQVKESPF